MQTPLSILVVEDEPRIRDGLVDFLEFHGFTVATAADGAQARDIVADRRFDMILLDLMLPKISGEQLCQQWRRQGLTTPILMVTARGLEQERIAGLELGADDYITKPFSLEELLARIRAVLRRTDPARSVGERFRLGPVEVDAAALKAWRNGREIPLTRRQARMLQVFAANPDRVISREELYRQAWGEPMGGIETRTVDMHIVKLRALIEPTPAEPTIIKTVRGAGYMYESAQADSGESHGPDESPPGRHADRPQP